ncbi:MAG TPA: hypothetical protein VIY68_02250, partial [Steroidobacteraceae bacterium]
TGVLLTLCDAKLPLGFVLVATLEGTPTDAALELNGFPADGSIGPIAVEAAVPSALVASVGTTVLALVALGPSEGPHAARAAATRDTTKNAPRGQARSSTAHCVMLC